MREIQSLISSLAPQLKKIDQIILNYSKGKSPLISQISNHLINSGGKRIRPILLILSARLATETNQDKVLNLAAAVELIHSATLLHDDVVDDSQIRRGKKTSNAIWDNKASILVGDFIFSIAFQLMVKSDNLEVLGLLASASSKMADGEVMQLEKSSQLDITQEQYLEIIFGKTAVLFAAACKSGGLIAGLTKEQSNQLEEFGANLGCIFQIIDDILDYFALEDNLGKKIGKDLFEAKVTLPLILTYQKADKEDKAIIEAIYDKILLESNQDQKNLNKITSLMDKYNIFNDLKQIVADFDLKAKNNLNSFTNSTEKEDLLTILNYSINRIY